MATALDQFSGRVFSGSRSIGQSMSRKGLVPATAGSVRLRTVVEISVVDPADESTLRGVLAGRAGGPAPRS